MRRIFFFFFVIFCASVVSAQGGTTPPSLGLVLGYNFYHAKSLELGIGCQPAPVDAIPENKPFAGISVSYDQPLGEDRRQHISFNAFWLARLAMGLNLNYNYDHVNCTYGIKPMIGLSWYRIGIMWGYNFFLSKNNINGLKHNEWTIRAYIPIINLKSK